MMPVRYEDPTLDLELLSRFDVSEYMDELDELPASLPSEDVWKKFDLLDMAPTLDMAHTLLDEHVDLGTIMEDLDIVPSCPAPEVKKEQLYSCCGTKCDRHDCMWGGFCASNDHGKSCGSEVTSLPPAALTTIKQEPPEPETLPQPAQPSPVKIKTEPAFDSVPAAAVKRECESVSVSTVDNTKVVSITTRTPSDEPPRRRYIVQRTVSRASTSPAPRSVVSATISLPANKVPGSCVSIVKVSPSRPETPQSLPESDDESTPIPLNNAGQALLKSAIDTIIGSATVPSYEPWDAEDSAALASWPASEVTGQVRRTSAPTIRERVSVTDSDHSYGIKLPPGPTYGSPIKAEDLGVQTPSDSEEEEVDVVSFQDTSSIRSSSRSSSVSRDCFGPSGTSRTRAMAIATQDEEDEDESSSNELEEPSTYFTKSQRYVKRKRRKSFSYDDDYTEDPKARRAQNRKRARVTKKKSSPAKSRFGYTDSEGEVPSDRRSFHNSMERKRRVDLRNSFEELRCLVPRIEHKKRSPKVVILNEAALFCMELSTSSQQMSAELAALRRKQEGLRSAVSMLRKSLAAAR
nr:PREDICTED: transcriptional regulator Myc-A-like [Bemisia tabaci]